MNNKEQSSIYRRIQDSPLAMMIGLVAFLMCNGSAVAETVDYTYDDASCLISANYEIVDILTARFAEVMTDGRAAWSIGADRHYLLISGLFLELTSWSARNG